MLVLLSRKSFLGKACELKPQIDLSLYFCWKKVDMQLYNPFRYVKCVDIKLFHH